MLLDDLVHASGFGARERVSHWLTGPVGGGDVLALAILRASGFGDGEKAAGRTLADGARVFGVGTAAVLDLTAAQNEASESYADATNRFRSVVVLLRSADSVPPVSLDLDLVQDETSACRVFAELLKSEFGCDAPAADEAAAELAPGFGLLDELTRLPQLPVGSLLGPLLQSAKTKSLIRSVFNLAGVAAFDLARVLLLLHPEAADLSDEWCQLASALANRPYSVADITRVICALPDYFCVRAADSSTVVSLASPLTRTLMTGGVPVSESEHTALFRALRDRAVQTLETIDASDRFVARELPRQSLMGGSLQGLLRDPLATLSSDAMALVREIESDAALATDVGGKTILLAAHRLSSSHSPASHLELSALRVGRVDFAHELGRCLPDRPWRAIWNRAQPVNANRVLLDRPSSAIALRGTSGSHGIVIASGHSDGTVWVSRPYAPSLLAWDGATFSGEVRAVDVREVGDRMLIAIATSDQRVLALDQDAARVLWERTDLHEAPLSAVAIGVRPTEDPYVASSGVDGTVRLLNIHTGAELAGSGFQHGAEIRALRTVPGNENLIAFCAVDGTVGILEVSSGVLVFAERVSGDVLNGLGCAVGDGSVTLAVGSSAGSLAWFEWDMNAKRRVGAIRTAQPHTAAINSVDIFERDANLYIVTAASDQTWRTIDLNSGTFSMSEAFVGHFAPIWGIAAVHDDARVLVASAGGEGNVRLWVLDAVSRESLALERPTRHTGAVGSVALFRSRNGELRVVTGGADGEVRTWGTATGSSGRPLLRQDAQVRVVTTLLTKDTDERVVLAGTMNGALHLVWLRPEDQLPKSHLRIAHEGVTALTVTELHAEPIVISAGVDGTLASWRLMDPTPVCTRVNAHYGAVTALSTLGHSFEDAILVVGSQDGTVSYHHVEDLEEQAHEQFKASITSLAPLPYATGLVVGLSDGHLAFTRNIREGASGWTDFVAHRGDLTGVASFVIGGRLVVASIGLDRRLCLWDLSTQLLLQEVDLEGLPLALAASTPHVAVGTTAGAVVIEFHSDPLVLARK